MRSSKELASRLRFDRFPRPDFFRRRFALVGMVAVAAGLGLWLFMRTTGGHMQYNPGPVTQNHASFGARCESCHDPFQNVQNEACLSCHPSRDHSQFVVRDADCRECHVEHLGDQGLLDVDNRTCVACHGDLQTKNAAPKIARDVESFAAHPQFAVLRDGASDTAAIRFNHSQGAASAGKCRAKTASEGGRVKKSEAFMREAGRFGSVTSVAHPGTECNPRTEIAVVPAATAKPRATFLPQ